jgi:sulfatase modifying factor 1
MMVSPENEPERKNDETLHEVILTKGFWLAETACMQELWAAVMGENPVERVS